MRAGRKKIELDLEEVEHLAGLGLTEEEIALSLGTSRSTIDRRKRDTDDFDAAIKRGRSKAKKTVANALFDAAKGGNMTAAIWIEKTRYGYTEKSEQQHSGEVVIRVRYEDTDAND